MPRKNATKARAKMRRPIAGACGCLQRANSDEFVAEWGIALPLSSSKPSSHSKTQVAGPLKMGGWGASLVKISNAKLGAIY